MIISNKLGEFIVFVKKSLGIFIASCFLFTTQVNAIENESSKLPVQEIKKIAEVYSHIDKSYVENVDKGELIISAIKGMAQSLDPYSDYLTSDEYNSFIEDIEGSGIGIGVIISKDESGLKIETVLKDSPAEKNGLESGDIIIKIKDKYIIDEYENSFDAIKDIKGDVNTVVNLSIKKHDTKKIEKIDITREVFTVPSTEVKLLDKNYGYIYISSFQEKTKKELKNKIDEFTKNNENVNGYVIDLRSNPGGLLVSAIEITDLFLDSGIIVSTKGRNPSNDNIAKAHNGDIFNGKPIVVLINSGSASASEIFAGALQDNNRAIIAGQTSFGKGSVQNIIPLNGDNGDALKMTIARYYTPSGRSIQAEGIVPDIFIEKIKNVEVISDNEHREGDRANHIENDTSYKSTTHKKEKESEDESSIITSIKSDYDLYEASNILKGMALFNKQNK